MLNLIIKFSRWVSLLNKSILSIARICLLSKSGKYFKQQKSNSEKLIVLGNGPSLKSSIQQNLDLLKSNNIICVNHFAISEYYTIIKPSYYIAIAHDLFLDDVQAHFVEASNILFNSIAEKTDWNLILFAPYFAKKQKRWKDKIINNKNIQIIWMNLTPIEGFEKFTFRNFNRACGMPRPHNVMVPAIFAAIHLKPQEILLYGADHTWLKELHVDQNNRALFFNEHFYDKDKKPKQFDFEGKSYLKLHEILKTMSFAFESYHILNKFAKYKNVKIINCTPESYIDAFERCVDKLN